jgi:mRNA interferase RelE/StbE
MYDFTVNPEAKKELEKLNKSVLILFSKKLKQILNSPEIGKNLGNKNNLKLAGLKKVYFNNKQHRIIYQVIESEIIIHIIAVGKRENMLVYKQAHKRFSNSE